MMKEKKWRFIRKTHPEYIRAAILAMISGILFCFVYTWDNSRHLEMNEQGQTILRRNSYGEGESESRLNVTIGDTEEEIDITVAEKMYEEEKLQKIFATAEEQLEKQILGENDSLDEVRSNLDLVTELPGTGVKISWESDNFMAVDTQGRIHEEELDEDGTLVRLTAVLIYGEEKAAYEFYIRAFPPKESSTDIILRSVKEEIKKSDDATKTEEYLILPETAEGETISWERAKDTRSFAILVMGMGGAVLICISQHQKKKSEKKKWEAQMVRDYPQMMNKFNLYIGAGMTVRGTWLRIINDYEKGKDRTGKHRAYEEMIHTMHQMRSGAEEGECYEEYGVRCGLSLYRKFGMLLSQNLRKGPKGLSDILSREAEEAFQERKNLAKKQGEEAGTRMVIPMFMMLSVVFAIVIIPALFTIKI